MAKRTSLHKPTALRLARTLAQAGFLVQERDTSWRLGPAAGLVGARYQAQFDINTCIEPVLQELLLATGESASFYVYEGQMRSCLVRADGPNGIRRHVRSGELLPLERGSAGRAILAALGHPGAVYDRIRQQGYSITRGERHADAASVAAPVYGAHGTVLGSVSLSGPKARLTTRLLRALTPFVARAAGQISYGLASATPDSMRNDWHP